MRHTFVFDVLFLTLLDYTCSENVLDSVKTLGKGSQKNTYLDEFLDKHSQPKITWDGSRFNLNIDERRPFVPPIRMAPFPSTGEPWPMPRQFTQAQDRVLKMDSNSFRINVLNKTCDILGAAIKRYTEIILKRTLPEPYLFPFNYNQKTKNDRKRQEDEKYKQSSAMKDLEIFVLEQDQKYPHIDMDESYSLTVKPDRVKLVAKHVWGALRGLETFSQLLFRNRGTNVVSNIVNHHFFTFGGMCRSGSACMDSARLSGQHMTPMPQLFFTLLNNFFETLCHYIYAKETEIVDRPRFPHRGIMIDTARHFQETFVIKDVLEGMAYNKMNVLHWHIVDDGSFPYQSEVYPLLSEMGAYHPSKVYSLKAIKEIVEYARLRGIRVIPEFDTPGHMFAWLGYPEIKATCYKDNQPLHGPAGPIDPSKDESYTFMSNLYNEIYEVFPDAFSHLGGDELHSDCWATNPDIKKHLEEKAGIKQSGTNVRGYVDKAIGYYFKRLISTLKDTAVKKGNRSTSFVMWEDVLKNTREVPKDSLMHVWYGGSGNVKKANKMGYRALFSNCWYLDSYHKAVMWEKYYKCEPSPYFKEEDEKGKLLGGEACLWAESITSDTLMTFMWPRSSAPAERLWSAKSQTDFKNAARRIQEQRCRMIYRGLQTGHISGPDYCLRYTGGPLGEHNTQDLSFKRWFAGTGGSTSVERSIDKSVTVTLITDYQNYLHFVNLLLSGAGVLFFIIAARRWRNKSNLSR